MYRLKRNPGIYSLFLFTVLLSVSSMATSASAGWSHQNPTPTDVPILSSHRVSATEMYFGASKGTILKTNSLTSETLVMNSGTTWDINGFFGTTNDLYAVASYGLLYYNGNVENKWSRVNTGFSHPHYSIWRASTGEIFIGSQGKMIYSNAAGTSWKTIAFPGYLNDDCLSVWGTSATNVYCGSYYGRIYHFDGTAIDSLSSGSNTQTNAIWGTSATNIYFAGGGGKIFLYDGTNFTDKSPTGESFPFEHIGGTSATAVVAVTERGSIYQLSGGIFGLLGISTPPSLIYHASGNAATDIIAGDYYGALYKIASSAWTRINPAPVTSNTLTDIWGATADDIYAVGPGTTFFHHISGATWTPVTVPSGSYTSIMGSSASNIWAVGSYSQILEYDGVSWSNHTANNASATPVGFTRTFSGKYLGVGNLGWIWEYNPMNEGWTKVASTTDTNPFYAVWDTGIDGGSGTTVYAVGSSGKILKRDLFGWSGTLETSNTGNTLYGVWGDADNNVYAVGFNGTIQKFNGIDWGAVAHSLGTIQLNAVWGSAGHVFAVGNSGEIYHFNGSTWANTRTTVPAGTAANSNHLYAVWGTSADNVYAVGAGGTIIHWDGAVWTKIPQSGTVGPIRSIWGTAANNIYAVGDSGALLRYDGTVWTYQQQKRNTNVLNWYFVNGTDATDIRIVDSNGAMAIYDGTSWGTGSAGVMPHLRDVHVFDANNAWAVGDGGTILKWNGTSWTRQLSWTFADLKSIKADDASNVIAVGDKVFLKSTNGGSIWLPSDVTYSFNDVWATTGFANIYATDGTGTIRRSTNLGLDWTDSLVAANTTFTNLWGTGNGDIFAGSSWQNNYHYNGTTWTLMDTGTHSALKFWGTESRDASSKANDVYGVGGAGLIVHFDGDAAAPVTYASPAGGSYGSVSANFECVDFRGIGCAETLYSDTGSTPTTTYTTGITLAENATLKFLSKDGAGNAEVAKSEVYVIDGTRPTTTLEATTGTAVQGTDGNTYVTYGTTISLVCTDNLGGSDCAATYYTTDWSNPTATDANLYTGPIEITYGIDVKFFSVDNMGNSEDTVTVAVRLDTNAPYTSVDQWGQTIYSPIDVNLSCSDYESGCAATYYTTDGSTPTTSSTLYAGAIYISETTTLQYFSVDVMGNTEAVQSQTYTFNTGGNGGGGYDGGCGGPGQPGCDNGGGDGGGCFIATAAYGSYLDPHVKTLRDFRDSTLLNSEAGRVAVDLYYTYSPYVADFIAESPAMRSAVRLGLAPVVYAIEYPAYTGLLSLMLAFGFGTLAYRREN